MTYDPFHAFVVFLFHCILLWGFGQLVDLGWHYYDLDFRGHNAEISLEINLTG